MCIILLFILFSVLLNLISRVRIPWLDGVLPFLDDTPDFFKYGDSIGALIAAILVVEQLGKEADTEVQETLIQQSTFIRDYNQSFIENEHMVVVEQELEEFYVSVNDLNRMDPDTYAEERKLLIERFKAHMGQPGSPERQAYVNYLVYLEGLSTVILNGAMTLDNVDSLFGYRFFIAVNNPAVQELELKPYAIHYSGIFLLYEKWVREKKETTIAAFAEYCLSVRKTMMKAALILGKAGLLANWEEAVEPFSREAAFTEQDRSGNSGSLAEVLTQHTRLLSDLKETCGKLANSKRKKTDGLIRSLEDSLIKIKHLYELQSTQTVGYFGVPLYVEDSALSRLEEYESTINARSEVKLSRTDS